MQKLLLPLAATALLVGAMKFDGLLILQARSAGPIPLLMVECSGDREIRGMARYEAEQIPADASLSQLMPDGHLTLTIDPGALPAPQHVLDKHFMRKHGPNAYYGQK